MSEAYRGRQLFPTSILGFHLLAPQKEECMNIRLLFFVATTFFFLAIPAWAQTYHGEATYYSNKFHGRRTSSGKLYHKDSLTCAHRTLPFGTLLKVRNKKNGREVMVEVTDRGPFRKNTIVDLSREAARQLDMISAGVAKVEVSLAGFNEINIRSVEQPLLVEKKPFLPELKIYDPISGKHYLLSEWTKGVAGEVQTPQSKTLLQCVDYFKKSEKEQPRRRQRGAKATARK